MTADGPRPSRGVETLAYLLLGGSFGVALVKSGAVSWWRIHEMFRFESGHLYATLASAVVTAFVVTRVLRARGVLSVRGEPMQMPAKVLGRGTRYWAGGTVFGIGWGVAGMCPGPLFALVGTGALSAVVSLLAALCGAYLYAHARPRLPH